MTAHYTSTSRRLKVLDLFSGAGGFSKGFESSGFEILGGVDFDKHALSTYAYNFPSAKAFLEDLDSPTEEFLEWLESVRGDVDVIIGGPPCQGFSIAGKRDPRDPRNRLYQKYIDIVKLLKPQAVLIENVPTIMTMSSGAVRESIIHDLESLGFNVSVETLNASFFGIPQARRRTFFVGTRTDRPFFFPVPTTKESPLTCWDALSDLPSLDKQAPLRCQKPKNEYQKLMRLNANSLHNHELVQHTETTKSIIALVPDGGNYKSLPLNLQLTRKVNIAWTRMNSKKPSFTIDAGHNHHFHYKENRVPSVRESARIQSFPDSFVFLGNRTSQYRQVGNAVPPLLASALADALKACL